MRINEAMDWLAEIFAMTFELIEVLGDGFNWILISIMFVIGLILIKMLVDKNREAERNGTLK